MTEESWVRSVYLYVMCAVSIVLVGVGLTTTVLGLVHTVAPDLGHRDTLDRVGIGLSNVAGSVVELMDDAQLGAMEDYCRDFFDEDEVEECIEDEQSSMTGMFGSIEDGITEVRDELESQIRNSSFDQMIRGVLMVGAGFVLFRIHGPRTAVFSDGLLPRRRRDVDAVEG